MQTLTAVDTPLYPATWWGGTGPTLKRLQFKWVSEDGGINEDEVCPRSSSRTVVELVVEKC